MVRWCEGAVYLTSPGRQLILAYSWARPAILVVGKGRGGMFLFLLFLHFHSCSSFFPVPLFHLLYSLFSPTLSSISFLRFSGRRHKMTLKGWRVVKPQHNQKPSSIKGGWNLNKPIWLPDECLKSADGIWNSADLDRTLSLWTVGPRSALFVQTLCSDCCWLAPHHTLLFHLKNIDIFLISPRKHMLWVLIRSASLRHF